MLSEFNSGPPPPCPAPFNLSTYLLGHARVTPDRTALAILGPADAQSWSFGQLENAVRATATGLLATGLGPGDIVLMRLGNTVDFPLAYLGAIAGGLVPVPTSSQLAPPEVGAIIDTLHPAAILHDPAVPCPATATPVHTLKTLQAWRSLPPAPYAMGDPDRLAYIIYTSGTSGVPRAVGHAHRAIWARRMMHQGWYGLRPSDRLLHAGAFNWTYTLGTGLMDPWSVGATALIPEPGIGHAQLPQLLARHKATLFAAAPGVFRNLLKSDMPALPDLRHGLCAGEKLSAPIRATWEKATGTPIHEAYGMSECSTFISAAPDHPARPGTLGRPQPGRRVAILGPDGPVPLGQPGTIAVHRRDPGLMLGYVHAPEATAAKFHGDWFLTGDQGSMDADGTVTYLGRADDMMNAGGYRVSPLEVEAALHHFPGIQEVGVTEVEVKPDVFLIAAFYTGPRPIDPATLSAWCADHLARYKHPRFFVHVAALPKNPNGKLLRRDLKPLFRP